jgi:uncharacterized protein YdbL (DUF1318 family)
MPRTYSPAAARLTSFWPAMLATSAVLDEARQSGRVGETLSGYLAARAQDSETLALTERIIDAANIFARRGAADQFLAGDAGNLGGG